MEPKLELLNIECLGKPLRLEGSLTGKQQLFWGDKLVSQKNASVDNGGLNVHLFELLHRNIPLALSEPQAITETVTQIRLETDLIWQPFRLDYRLLKDDDIVNEGYRIAKDLERQPPVSRMQKQKKAGIVGLISLAFKLLKSTTVIKATLATISITAYTWLFSLQLALALLACLVIHEYGHIRAMKYFGMRTKGIYLVPFLGGLALSDTKINTRWQDVVIAIMGPTFGLLLSISAVIAYHITGNLFFAGLATVNALFNIFNLLPILPLDGGHILKSISFSMHGITGLATCVIGVILGAYLSYTLSFTLLGFLLLIGSIEILFEWRHRYQSHLIPLDRYGKTFSLIWYLLTLVGLVSIIWHIGNIGDNMLTLPLKILQS